MTGKYQQRRCRCPLGRKPSGGRRAVAGRPRRLPLGEAGSTSITIRASSNLSLQGITAQGRKTEKRERGEEKGGRGKATTTPAPTKAKVAKVARLLRAAMKAVMAVAEGTTHAESRLGGSWFQRRRRTRRRMSLTRFPPPRSPTSLRRRRKSQWWWGVPKLIALLYRRAANPTALEATTLTRTCLQPPPLSRGGASLHVNTRTSTSEASTTTATTTATATVTAFTTAISPLLSRSKLQP
mmetsp:Transcript_7911/g.15856  ORF Transcript_7911/g.15856 Transcript_7911/m.15856 type:complete len:239 (+) Transcript_7911:775-1491(+)